jgi:dimethylglycine dehydrogenase
MERIVCRRMPRVGRVVLAYALTDRGGVLSEYTITRIAENRFYLLAAGSAEWHDLDWLEAHQPLDGSVQIEDVSESGSTLVVAGPRSRELLSEISDADLSNAAFPWSTGAHIRVAERDVLALRINYVGELGWELHVPMADLVAVYDALFAVAAKPGLRDFGMYAVDSLRLEKAYRGWKQDLSTEYTPFEAGLDRFVDLRNPDFIGRMALLARQGAGLRERFVPLIVEAGSADAPVAATVFKDGEQIGIVSSGGWGHRIGKSVALAYVHPGAARPGTQLDVEIFGERRPAVVAEEPIFDPFNERLRA